MDPEQYYTILEVFGPSEVEITKYDEEGPDVT